ncbi:MAG: hypothetical protein WBQ25_13010 [Nitrososphaeraceae archaeon]
MAIQKGMITKCPHCNDTIDTERLTPDPRGDIEIEFIHDNLSLSILKVSTHTINQISKDQK